MSVLSCQYNNIELLGNLLLAHFTDAAQLFPHLKENMPCSELLEDEPPYQTAEISELPPWNILLGLLCFVLLLSLHLFSFFRRRELPVCCCPRERVYSEPEAFHSLS